MLTAPLCDECSFPANKEIKNPERRIDCRLRFAFNG